MRRCLALLVLVPAVGCGDIKTIAEDAAPGEADAAPDADLGNPADPLIGTWSFWIDDPPDGECDVTIDGESYEVYCPSDPYDPVPDCTRTKNDTRIRGTWTDAFAGTFDSITRYEGTGCTGEYTPVDVDIVEQGVLTMDATHAAASQATGFLQLAYGSWDWTLREPGDGGETFGCAVSFEPGDGADSVAFRVECVDPDTTEPVQDCTLTNATVVTGTLGAAEMIGEGWGEDRYDGSGCAPTYPDPVVEELPHTPMGASKL